MRFGHRSCITMATLMLCTVPHAKVVRQIICRRLRCHRMLSINRVRKSNSVNLFLIRKKLSTMADRFVAAPATSFLFDAHCHMQFEPLLTNSNAVVQRSQSVGVSRASICGTRPGADWAAVATLANRFPDFVVPCLGLHPYWIHEYITTPEQRHYASPVALSEDPESQESCSSMTQGSPSSARIFDSKKYEEELQNALIALGPICHVGECGLDKRLCDLKSLSRSSIRSGLVPMDMQLEVLRSHIRVARKLNRTLVLHCVGAWGTLFEVFREEASNGLEFAIVLHSCNSISVDMARAFSKLGPFYFSFSGGHLTPKITSLVEAIPMDRLLLESDAPDQILTSVDLDNIESIEHVAPLIRDYERVALISDPDKRINEPYRVAILCHTVAQYLSMSPVHLGDVARQNAERVFLGA